MRRPYYIRFAPAGPNFFCLPVNFTLLFGQIPLLRALHCKVSSCFIHVQVREKDSPVKKFVLPDTCNRLE